MRMKETSFLGLDNFDNPAFEASPSPSTSTTVDVEMNAILPISPSEPALEASNNLSKKPLAVSVRNAYKSYHKGTPVLDNLSMSVPTGCIYSLLGSSGCGKSTLLSCCVGIGNLNQGEILMYGHQPGTKESGVPGRRVGYMPQELSLYNELKIREAFNFYGRIYGMTSEQVEESTKFLIEFLDLPPERRRIGTLSGGQKRRVSFAIALIHCPQLLILDEPTVGVDPLLRENIWNYLVRLVNTDGTTVIITTHYIEEARQSNLIGIMRRGRLLEEKSPQVLLDEYDVTLLEDIVLSLCRMDLEEKKKGKGGAGVVDVQKQINTTVQINSETKKKNVFQTFPDENEGENNNSPARLRKHSTLNRQDFPVDQQTSFFQKAAAVLIKNFIVMMRNIGFLAFIFFIPALQMVLISLAIGSDPKGLNVGVVNQEECDFEGEGWREILNDCPLSKDQGGTESLSCFYLAALPTETFHLINEKSEADALTRVENGYTYGFIHFPSNFTLNVECRVSGPTLGGCDDNPLAVKLGSKISYSLDLSSKPIGQTMKRMFIETYLKTMSKVNTNCNSSIIANILYELTADQPYNFRPPIYGKDDMSFKDFLAPSVLLALLFFFPLCSSGVTYIAEKKSGTLDRALVAGIGTTEFMGGYLLIQVVILLGQTGISFLILSLVFNLEIVGSVILALTLTVLVGISGMSAGFLIAVFCSDEFQAVLLAMGTFFPNVLLAGVIWPPEGMVKALQYVSYFLPCTWACESMRSIVSRGWGIMHRDVWPGFLSTLAWTVVYWILTVVVHRIKHKM
ncbi:unnamed protein product [Orchesella dallaii]|uniref:ABC transporter G family member 20 n=1 Tax=Orchesella dallaii TaxID=48710 RepID=A0ABP1S8C5_9HEXA